MRAKCFSEEEKTRMIERVRTNQTGMQNKKFRKEQMIEALLDPQAWCHCLIAICTTLPTSGLGAFFGIVIAGYKFSVLNTQLLAMVLGFYIIIVLLSSVWLVNKYKQNLIVMGIFMIPYVYTFTFYMMFLLLTNYSGVSLEPVSSWVLKTLARPTRSAS